LFAYRNPSINFTGVDFSNSVDWARDFAHTNSINNVTFVKDDLVNFDCTCTFDLVICQGVLHHIPDYKQALSNLKSLISPGGRMILGLYHPWGKLAKQFISIDYGSNTLYQDQENNPFELSFSKKQVKQLTQEFDIVDTYPSLLSSVALPALFNYRNGGLVVYVLEKKLI
jgi:SAM-dependent methyltransferase